MNTPPFLKPGDKVGILATARRIKPEDITRAVEIFREWGLEVELSPNLVSTEHSYLAGTDEQRATALQLFIDDPSINAVFCARGGYGTTRIIDQIDFSQYIKSPKWIIGFSDVTALHLRIFALGSKSIHGVMPVLFSKTESASSIESLRKALFGQLLEITAGENKNNKVGTAQGKLVGGNLSLLVDSLGTPDELRSEGKILVIEEVDEYLYKIDRMFVQLKRSKKLEKLAGIVVGHFSEIKDTELPFGESFEEIIRFHTREFNYPIGFNFPIGHLNPNYAWISGGDSLLEVTEKGSTLYSLPSQAFGFAGSI
jgi:muramoyltetrapeptide carboxypeptidase